METTLSTAELELIERADEQSWVRLDDVRRWCTIHSRIFEQTAVYSLAPGVDAHGICPDCVRAPKRPADIAVQDWWKPVLFGDPQRAALRCALHEQLFEIDEGCRQCFDEEDDD